MVSVKQTKQVLAVTIVALLIASMAIKMGAGVGVPASVLDTFMSGLQMDYIGLTAPASAHSERSGRQGN